MDMITKLEIEEAVAVHAKVADRVKEVALKIAEIENTFENVRGMPWRLRSWHINLRAANSPEEDHQREHAVTVDFECNGSRRFVDDYGLDGYGRQEGVDFPLQEGVDFHTYEGTDLFRWVRFPIDYLLNDDWEDEVRAEAGLRAEAVRERQLEAVRNQLADLEKRTVEARAKLEELSSNETNSEVSQSIP